MTDNPLDLKPVTDPLAKIDRTAAARALEGDVHLMGKKEFRCATDERGHSTPHGLDLAEIRLDSHLGFIPLWDRNVVLRWRFKDSAFAIYQNPEAAKEFVRELMKAALSAWGPKIPIAFSEQRDLVDFEVVVQANPDCDQSGCVLASAFFPDAGRHELKIYPTMFEQDRAEQIETLAHEFGHIFGLRHWFAAISETDWASQVYGSNSQYSIMNYGEESVLTDADRRDLDTLYQAVWSGQLDNINGTPIRLFRPFSSNY